MASYDVNVDAYLSSIARTADQDDVDNLATHALHETIADPSGKTVIDLCCGDGRLGLKLLEMGAKSVIGVDMSDEKLSQAWERRKSMPAALQKRIRFVKADIRSSTLALPPADIVTGLYVLHHANSLRAIRGMGRFIARNMKPGGLCSLVTLNPNPDPDADHSGAQVEVDILEHELENAGLRDFAWTRTDLPDDRPDLQARFSEWRKNPQCVVFSARKAAVV